MTVCPPPPPLEKNLNFVPNNVFTVIGWHQWSNLFFMSIVRKRIWKRQPDAIKHQKGQITIQRCFYTIYKKSFDRIGINFEILLCHYIVKAAGSLYPNIIRELIKCKVYFIQCFSARMQIIDLWAITEMRPKQIILVYIDLTLQKRKLILPF